MVIRKDGIDVSLPEDGAKNLEGIAGDADETRLAQLLHLPQRGDGFIYDLIKVAVFVVMRLNDIDIVDSQTAQAVVDAGDGALGGKIKLGVAVASNFRRQKIAVAGNSAECLTQDSFGLGVPVKGRDIDKVNA